MIILASSSPRRKEIMDMIGLNYQIIKSDFDEKSINIYNYQRPLILSKLKGDYVYKNHLNDLVLSFDTIVYYNGKIFEKPKDFNDAYNMLKQLSNNMHYVYTGIYIKSLEYEKNFLVKTKIYFKDLTDKEIIDYINTNDCFDKAGAYGIQSSNFVKKYKGDYYNVMGLPYKIMNKELHKYKYKKYLKG